jgi:16S rRNA (cytosine967-C5)-methyltransferase
MSLAGSQQKVFLRLVAALRPHWRRDPSLPARIQAQFAANRSFGSRDRKLHRELIYTTLRFLPWIEPLLDTDPDRATQVVAWLAAELPATRLFRTAICAGWPPCPPTVAARAAHLDADATALLPAWFARHCPEAGKAPELDALHTRAALWLRLQAADPAAVTGEFDALNWTWRRAEVLSTAIELRGEVDVTKTRAWQEGLIEVQDLGSQLILEAAGIAPGERWLDACAGAGGKTLQLAQLLGSAGRVDAHDIRADALRELEYRARRAGIPVASPSPSPSASGPGTAPGPAGVRPAAAISILGQVGTEPEYDGVLVDAPCSGSGTWRRSPHLKWTTGAGQVMQAAARQLSLLQRFSALVRPGGRLIYATCSLSRFENDDVIAGFLREQPGFAPAPLARHFGFTPGNGGLTLLPARHDTDGFFVASLVRSPSPAT